MCPPRLPSLTLLQPTLAFPPGGCKSAPPPGPLPPADFTTLINSLLVQVFFCLGRISDPSGKNPEINLDLAKHHIDMLEVLDEKTKGNLTEDENKKLALALHEARMQYVQIAGV